MKMNTFIVIAKVQKILINNNELVKFYQMSSFTILVSTGYLSSSKIAL